MSPSTYTFSLVPTIPASLGLDPELKNTIAAPMRIPEIIIDVAVDFILFYIRELRETRASRNASLKPKSGQGFREGFLSALNEFLNS